MSETVLDFELQSTALVVVDLQNFALALDTVPIPTAEVLANTVRIADVCRDKGILVVLIRVGHDDNKTPHPSPKIDAGFSGFQMGPGAKELAPALGPKPGVVIVDKYNW